MIKNAKIKSTKLPKMNYKKEKELVIEFLFKLL